ncbi:hypothetical protein ACHAXS_014105 [Conticribra weissflogii]
MRSRPSALVILAIYAFIATLGVSYYVIRDIASQIAEIQDEEGLYSYQLIKRRPLHRISSDDDNDDRFSKFSADSDVDLNVDVQRSPTFPIKYHIVTQGHPRTATTLLFNMVATSYFLYLLKYDSDKASKLGVMQFKRDDAEKFLKRAEGPYVLKTHNDLSGFLVKDTVLFTAALDKNEAREAMERLTREGHTVAFIQDMESLKENGVLGLVEQYVDGFGLSSEQGKDLADYFSKWEILRQCCGQQMSARWRNDMLPEKFKRKDLSHHPTCPTYDIDEVEQKFMKTNLFSLIEQYSNMLPMNRPSLNDDDLNGTYCSSYNHLVRTEGLSIWGTPGGRPVRSDLDHAIKHQFLLGTEHLEPEGVALLQNNTYRNVWRYPDKEKQAWLETVKNARDKEYEEAAGAEIRESKRRRRRRRHKQQTESSNEELNNDDDSSSDIVDEIEPYQELVSAVERSEDALKKADVSKVRGYDHSHAIFLISFGKEASESTLVERCVLSLRRRGKFKGYVVVLTDASLDRYQNEWESKVIVVNPLPKHFLAEDGTQIRYSKANASLKYKRFKTFVLDYFNLDKRLDAVETIYYLDIDIMAANDLGKMFEGLSSKYGVLQPREERKIFKSRIYFFTPLSKEWPLQGGTFILERSTSHHCLELWRKEIDDFANTVRGRDQDALAKVYKRIESKEETQCELVRMENKNYIALPTPRTFDSIDPLHYPTLIHISNSVFAKRIDEEKQSKLINDVLLLTMEEKQSGKYGKAVVHVGDR